MNRETTPVKPGNVVPLTDRDRNDLRRAWAFRFPVPTYVRASGWWSYSSPLCAARYAPEELEAAIADDDEDNRNRGGPSEWGNYCY